MISFADNGMYCEKGGFYIGPWKPVAKAPDNTRPQRPRPMEQPCLFMPSFHGTCFNIKIGRRYKCAEYYDIITRSQYKDAGLIPVNEWKPGANILCTHQPVPPAGRILNIAGHYIRAVLYIPAPGNGCRVLCCKQLPYSACLQTVNRTACNTAIFG